MIAAGALYALHHHRERLVDDHRHASRIGDAVSQCEHLSVLGGAIDTNIIALAIDPSWGTAADFVSQLADNGLACFAIGPQSIRMVTHLDVSSSQIDQACTILQHVATKREHVAAH